MLPSNNMTKSSARCQHLVCHQQVCGCVYNVYAICWIVLALWGRTMHRSASWLLADGNRSVAEWQISETDILASQQRSVDQSALTSIVVDGCFYDMRLKSSSVEGGRGLCLTGWLALLAHSTSRRPGPSIHACQLAAAVVVAYSKWRHCPPPPCCLMSIFSPGFRG